MLKQGSLLGFLVWSHGLRRMPFFHVLFEVRGLPVDLPAKVAFVLLKVLVEDLI